MVPNKSMLIWLAVVGCTFGCEQAGDSRGLDELSGVLAGNVNALGAGSEQAAEFSFMLLPELALPKKCMPDFTLKDEYPTSDLLETKISRRIPTPVTTQTEKDTIFRMGREIAIAKQDGLPPQPDIFYLRTLKPTIDRLVDRCHAETALSKKRIIKKRDSSIALKAFQAECKRKGCSYFGFISHSFKGCRERIHGATNPAIYAESIPLLLRNSTHVSFNPKISKHSAYYAFAASCTKKIEIIPPPPEDH